MQKLMTNSFIGYFLNQAQVSSNKTMSNLTRKDKNRIVNNLKHFPFIVSGIFKEDAKVTIGGVKIDEINNKTLESKLNEGLYFAGEILEPAGPTGGYNLQLCFSTGYLAGKSASESLK
jgi:predicted flavoprotein YhiN